MLALAGNKPNAISLVAVHGPHQVGEGAQNIGGQAGSKSCGLLRKIESKIGKRAPVPLAELQRFPSRPFLRLCRPL